MVRRSPLPHCIPKFEIIAPIETQTTLKVCAGPCGVVAVKSGPAAD